MLSAQDIIALIDVDSEDFRAASAEHAAATVRACSIERATAPLLFATLIRVESVANPDSGARSAGALAAGVASPAYAFGRTRYAASRPTGMIVVGRRAAFDDHVAARAATQLSAIAIRACGCHVLAMASNSGAC